MLITSTSGPGSSSNGNLPISIFRYKDERRFLRVSESYEETIERVVNSFQIESVQTILLQTSCFTACRGRHVVIDSSAYPLLWLLLEEVEVVVTTKHVPETDEVAKGNTNNLVEQPFAVPSSPVAGPSHDGLGVQIQDARPTPSPVNPSEDELPKEEEIPTPASPADPLFQWDDDIQQDEEQVEKVSTSPQPERKLKAPANLSTKMEPDSAPIIKKEKQEETDASSSSRLEPQTGFDNPIKRSGRSATDDDTRFDVVIVGPDEDHTQFKLRGKNSVRKVLAAACRNFEVDPNDASLVYSMELEVDGELQTHNFVCSPDDTIAMCGIKAGSKLFVEVNPVTKEEQVDYVSE